MAASKIPGWVTAELFEDLLKANVEGFSKVKSFKADSGSAAGENYATIMLRVNIEVELQDGKSKPVSYMVKLPHQLEMFQEMMKRTNIFDIERTMYNQVVPEIEAIYEEVGVDITFGARSYDLKNAKTDYVALEDLGVKGFKNANRLEGFDQAHTERVLQKLAQWHAASAVRVTTKGSYTDILLDGLYKEENRPMMTEMMKGIGSNFVKSCPTYEGYEVFIDKVKALQPVLIDKMFDFAKVDPMEFNVLNHGDSWSNNIMFQYDAFGKIKEVYLVDYQLPKYGTVAQDLLYFLISSTKLEDKLSKFDYYIKVYHENLVEHLKILKYSKPIPSLRDIHLALFKYGFFGYTVATGVMAAVLLDPTDTASFENFVGDTEAGLAFQMQLFNSPRFRKHIQVIMPWLLNRGALDM
ncbi:uncharacterized protein LOC108045619 isoform X2 [Drosophila rhopaloa]|uniref:CHK kinase-like domain-containing protein n=1 Tax=Drosophila rhopaloa TaxID=1041015 RepID=A0ABM5HHP0_DRORH|nr:uncharacterized protein LOC108045619 isoform X2 [Drosophila rhopaloa]